MKKNIFIFAKIAILSSLVIASCALPINKLNSVVEQKENLDLPIYSSISQSENYSKPIERWTPSKVDKNLKDRNQYTSTQLLLGENYLNLLKNLSDEDFKNDIKDSLIDEIKNKEISIDFHNSWEFIFKTIQEEDKKIISNFHLQFNITNYGLFEVILFDKIKIESKSNSRILIKFDESAKNTIEPWYVLNPSVSNYQDKYINNYGNYAASWIINITKNIDVEITYNKGILKDKVEIFTLANKWFVMGGGVRSYALSKNFVNFYKLPSYLSVQNVALKNFQEMSENDYANDLMDWYLTYYRYQWYLAFKDIKFIINYFFTENLKHPTEKKKLISIIEYALIDKSIQNKLIAQFRTKSSFDTIVKRILTQLFNKKEDAKLTYENFYVLMNYIKNLPIEEFIDKGLEIEFIWKQKPILNFQDINQPKISFDFKTKTNFKNDFYIQTSGVGKYKDKEINFDLKDAIEIKDLINEMTDSNNPIFSNNSPLSNLIDYLLPSVFGLKENESYTINFQAIDSPLQFYPSYSFASIKKNNVSFGWAATDVRIDYDFSNINFLWESIARKLDNYNLKNKYIDLNENSDDEIAKRHAKKDNELNKIAYDLMAKLPKKEHLTIQNAKTLFSKMNDILQVASIFNEIYTKPFSILLKKIASKNFTINSSQLEVGISRAFYNLPEKYNLEPLYLVIDDSNEMHYVSNSKISLANIQNNSANKAFNFDLLTKELEEMNLSYNYEIYDSIKFDWTWDQKDLNEKVKKLNNDSSILENLEKYVKESFELSLKTKWNTKNNKDFLEQYKNINPLEKLKISLIKIDLLDALNSAMNSKIKATGIIGLILRFKIVDLSKIPGALIKRNAWIVIINSGTTTLETQNYIVPPIFDFENILKNINKAN